MESARMFEELKPAFDSVSICDGGVWQPIGVAEFFEIPLSRRIRHVLERTVRFSLRGVEIDRKDALASLRRTRTDGV
ncbi:MAG: hypothetical protein ACRENE_32795 [Polyangiaceae bacterium]